MQKTLLDVLQKKMPLTPPPMWVMRQAGRYLPEYKKIRASVPSFLDLCFTPELAVEVTLQPIRRFQMDGAILFSDILVIPYAMGRSLTFQEGGPKLNPLRCVNDIDKLSIKLSKLNPIYETLTRLRGLLPGSTTLIGFAGGPWTVACYMIDGESSKDFHQTKIFAATHPKAFKRLLMLIAEVTAEYLVHQIDAGAEVIQIFESWAGLVPEQHVDDWLISPVAHMIHHIKHHTHDVPVIAFPRGYRGSFATYATLTQADGLSVDTTAFKSQWEESSCVLQGGFDPAYLLGPREAIGPLVQQHMDNFKGRPYIFNLGHGILPTTPIENVYALVDAVRSLGGSQAHWATL